MNKRIIFFDGYCNLCNRFIDFVVKHDRNKKFFFSPLTGQTATQLNIQVSSDYRKQSIFYYDPNCILHMKSDAVLRIISELFSFGSMFLILLLIPKLIRDSIYQTIAKNRYRIFGKSNSCRLPTEEEKKQFLD